MATVTVRKTVKVKTVTTTTTTIVKRVRKAPKPNGVILYRGPSALNGQPIVAVAVGLSRGSKNGKTGRMIQVYILADGINPLEALQTGADKAICGSCPLRKVACYVNVAQAPVAIHKAIERGVYPTYDPARHLELFAGRDLRLGSYGDPVAVPFSAFAGILDVVAMHTAYTHQWRRASADWKRVCHASVQSEREREMAVSKGWSTFRVRTADQPKLAGEFICPASSEGGKRLTCQDCGACSGNPTGQRKATPVIIVHGLDWKAKAFQGVIRKLAK